MRRPPVIAIVSNALDDATRLKRNINTDSPAASRKVFMLCQALRTAGIRAYVLSLGRGRTNGTAYFSASVRRVGGIPVIYAPFSQKPILSQILSLFGLIPSLLRLSRTPLRSVVFYNRMNAYLPTLFMARVTGFRCLLDLEDGEVISQGIRHHFLRNQLRSSLNAMFDFLCRDGALLACSALDAATLIRPTTCYYGSTSLQPAMPRWQQAAVTVLMSGTLDKDTGANLLVDAIRLLREESGLSRPLRIEVTGKGASLCDFEALAAEDGLVSVIVHGRVSNVEYQKILSRCDVGLALKPVGGVLANTTFPSKVIEFADAGLLVLTTDVSDVRKVLGDGAIYLTDNDAMQLARLLREILISPAQAQQRAQIGTQAVIAQCSPLQVGRSMAAFIQGE